MVNATDSATAGLQVYIVGGAVRDELLGLAAGDRDWVVVGSSPQVMLARGFTPVGADFPVFLHPLTHEEYALARTERKSGHGYKGFTFYAGTDVSLADDLRRRDLTINAIAKDTAGNLIDPLGGQADINARVLRHIGAAFTEDPVRLLRLARFAARFSDFTIAAETKALCAQIVASGEVDALVPERVWQEFAKGLSTNQPARMLTVLAECGALARLCPDLNWNDTVAAALGQAVIHGLDTEQRFAILWALSAAQPNLRAPANYLKMAELLPKVLKWLRANGTEATNEQLLTLLEQLDALRKPKRCFGLIQAAACFTATGPLAVWQQRINAINAIDAGAIAKQAKGNVSLIKQNIRAARLQALAAITNQ